MSTPPRRRALGTGPALPAPAVRDPRALTAAERAAAGEWTAEPAPPSPPPSRPRRRPLGTGPADAGTAPAGPGAVPSPGP
ncbi:hypothetical protein [Streptomyces sp. NPDC091278]|uniref:hypothetical protein n=1 Tax=Streptomyces sp. NPDC091278 TaxID=3155301 RepID=UPI00344C396A